MENKYFTPGIADIYVSYELEWKSQIIKQDWEITVCDIDLISIIYDEYEHADIEEPFNQQFRVPYLTKEQIEAEGWELIQIYPKGACIFQKGTKEEGYELTCDFTEHRVHFTELYFCGLDDEYTRTKLTWRSLECKDINTFRKICKLLEI